MTNAGRDLTVRYVNASEGEIRKGRNVCWKGRAGGCCLILIWDRSILRNLVRVFLFLSSSLKQKQKQQAPGDVCLMHHHLTAVFHNVCNSVELCRRRFAHLSSLH